MAACEVCGVEAGFLYVEGAKICGVCGEEQFGDFSNSGKMDKKFKLHEEVKGKKDKKNNRIVSDDEIFFNNKRKRERNDRNDDRDE